MSYPVEIRVAKAYCNLLKTHPPGTVERKVLLVLLENQLRRIGKNYPRKEISRDHAELLLFMQETQEEAMNARADLNALLSGPAATKRRAAYLLQKFERKAAWRRRTGIPPVEVWKPVSGGAPDSNRSTH